MENKDDALERDLRRYDFSQNHPIRDGLFSRLLAMHRMDNMRYTTHFLQGRHLLSDEELDYVVAAGSPNLPIVQESSFAMTVMK